MATIDEKTKVPLYAAGIVLSSAIGFAVWITSVAADAHKGAKAADKVTVMYYDIKAIKKQLKIKEEPIPEEE